MEFNRNLADPRSLTPAHLALHTSGGRWHYYRHLQVIQKAVLPIFLDPLAPKRIRISAPPQHGKPLWVETPVLMADGSILRLGSVRVGDRVIGKSGRPGLVTHVYEQGHLPALAIETHGGRKVTTALDHSFLTPNGWVEAKDLEPGDNLALLPGAITPGNARITFRVLGYEFRPDRITQITMLPEPVECRCLTVADEESFLANDLVVHNSAYLSGWLIRWILGHLNDFNVAVCSYNKDVAATFGEQNRDWFLEWGPEIFGKRVSTMRYSAHNWGFSGDSSRHYSVGLKGGLTSKKVDLMVIDDPFKDEEEARSLAQRDRVWRWYGGVCNSRLSARGIIILVQTRWHDDDLIGRVKAHEAEMGDPWLDINIPAIAAYPDEVPEKELGLWFPDPLGRQPGEALCPRLHPIEQLLESKRVLGEDRFWKIYQGSPRPGRGGIFDEGYWGRWSGHQFLFRYDPGRQAYYYRTTERYDAVTISMDCSWKDTASADFTVIGVWAQKGADHLLLYVKKRRMNLDTACEELCAIKALYPMAQEILIEDKANGPEVRKRLRSVVGGILMQTPRGSKVERAEAVRHLVAAGNVLLPEKGERAAAGWVTDFISECGSFPFGVNDDQVDMLTQYLIRAIERQGSSTAGMRTAPKKPISPPKPVPSNADLKSRLKRKQTA